MPKVQQARSHEEKVKLALEVCEFLNELVAIDCAAITELIEARVACNAKMVEHPTVQVMVDEDPYFFPRLGVLGLLNGLIGGGYIVAVFDETTGALLYFVARVAQEKEVVDGEGVQPRAQASEK